MQGIRCVDTGALISTTSEKRAFRGKPRGARSLSCSLKNIKRMEVLIRIVAALSVACALARISGAQDWQRLGPEGGIGVSLGAGGGGTVYLGAADGHAFARGDDPPGW